MFIVTYGKGDRKKAHTVGIFKTRKDAMAWLKDYIGRSDATAHCMSIYKLTRVYHQTNR